MCKQHAQGNRLLLLLQGPIFFKDSQPLQLRTQLFNLRFVVEGEAPSLDELHARDAYEEFCAGCNPEDCVEGHGLRRLGAAFSGCVREELSSGFVDNYDDGAGDGCFGVCAGVVNEGAECREGVF
jgi:hypothetical protein